MLYEIRKAFEAVRHPGIRSDLLRMTRNAIPYYLSPSMKVPTPVTVYWSVNSLCNLRCKMCDVGMANEDGTFFKNLVIDKTRQEIDIEVFKSVIDEVAADKPYIAIISTEPLIYKPLPEAISYCRERGLEVAVTTGGYSLPKMARTLVEAGLSRLNVSIDGPPEIHNDMRRRKDSFQRSVAGIRDYHQACQELGHPCEIVINAVITNMNYAYLVDLYEQVKDLPITALNYVWLCYISEDIAVEQNALYGGSYPVSTSCVNNFNNPADIDVDVTYDQMQALRGREKVHFLPYFSKQEITTCYKEPMRFIKKNGRCLASWMIINILADGRVIPFTRCHNESLGNVNDSSFSQIWNGEKMKQWRRFIKKKGKMPMCKRCDLIY